jgi:hypothetical protein
MLDTDGTLLDETVLLERCASAAVSVVVAPRLICPVCRLRPEQPANTWRVTTLVVGLAVDVYFNEVWWQGYLRCQSPATADFAGEWLVYCPETNDEVEVDVAAWEAELVGAQPVDGAIRSGLSWLDGVWLRRTGEDDQSIFSDATDNDSPMPRRPVRRQLVPDSSLDGVSVSKGDPAARPLMTPAALEALFLPLGRLHTILEAHGNDVAALCGIIPGGFVRSFTDQDSVLASRLWIVASASVRSAAGGLASIELCDAESGDVILASALCNAAPTGLDLAALMSLPSFSELTLGGCREVAARLAVANGMSAQAARTVIQPADEAAHAALAAHYGTLATPVFGMGAASLPGMPDFERVAAAALRPCTFHRCGAVPAAMALPRYCYYPPPPAERVPAGPFCVACLGQWSKQMQDDFGLWPEGGGPPSCVTYGSVMRDARAAGVLL